MIESIKLSAGTFSSVLPVLLERLYIRRAVYTKEKALLKLFSTRQHKSGHCQSYRSVDKIPENGFNLWISKKFQDKSNRQQLNSLG
jgi:hypothetical protein